MALGHNAQCMLVMVLGLDPPIFFLPRSVEDVEKGNLVVDDTLLTIGILNSLKTLELVPRALGQQELTGSYLRLPRRNQLSVSIEQRGTSTYSSTFFHADGIETMVR